MLRLYKKGHRVAMFKRLASLEDVTTRVARSFKITRLPMMINSCHLMPEANESHLSLAFSATGTFQGETGAGVRSRTPAVLERSVSPGSNLYLVVLQQRETDPPQTSGFFFFLSFLP